MYARDPTWLKMAQKRRLPVGSRVQPYQPPAIARLHNYSKVRRAIRSGVLSSGNIKVDPKPS